MGCAHICRFCFHSDPRRMVGTTIRCKRLHKYVEDADGITCELYVDEGLMKLQTAWEKHKECE